MANIQIKNIPDVLHKRLKMRAKKQNCTISKIVLEAIERELERREWLARVPKKPKIDVRDL